MTDTADKDRERKTEKRKAMGTRVRAYRAPDGRSCVSVGTNRYFSRDPSAIAVGEVDAMEIGMGCALVNQEGAEQEIWKADPPARKEEAVPPPMQPTDKKKMVTRKLKRNATPDRRVYARRGVLHVCLEGGLYRASKDSRARVGASVRAMQSPDGSTATVSVDGRDETWNRWSL